MIEVNRLRHVNDIDLALMIQKVVLREVAMHKLADAVEPPQDVDHVQVHFTKEGLRQARILHRPNNEIQGQ